MPEHRYPPFSYVLLDHIDVAANERGEGDVREERKEKEICCCRRMAGFLRRLLAALAVELGEILLPSYYVSWSFSSSCS